MELQKFVDCVEPLMDISPYVLSQLSADNVSTLSKLKMILQSPFVKSACK